MRLHDLPNVHGFRFTGILGDGKHVECKVVLDPKTGCYTVEDGWFPKLVGWLPVLIQINSAGCFNGAGIPRRYPL